jgi:hypothetical protein
MEVVCLERVPTIEASLLAAHPVAQVSKPAVSPISESAACESGLRVRTLHGSQVWKPAKQQTWKSAVRGSIPDRCGLGIRDESILEGNNG